MIKVNPSLEDEELFTRLLLKKCMRASPSLISEVRECSDTIVSSKSRMSLWKNEVSASEPKDVSTSSGVKRLLFIRQPKRKLSAMLMNRFLVLHFILLWQISSANIIRFFRINKKTE